jgi:proline iminopeptidase
MNASMHKSSSYYLQTNSKHKVFYTVLGKGIPVLVVHGGPGAGCSLNMTDFFDLNKFMVILVDQRGCGKSTPNACIENNTTFDLISDFEEIRKKLKISKWLLFGGSWGSTLSLIYAISHPEIITGMVLRGVFLSTQSEINWLFNAAKYFNLNCWNDFSQGVDSSNLLEYYHKKLTSTNPETIATYAKKFAKMEATLSYLKPNKKMIEAFTNPKFSIALARIEVHYLKNKCFLPSEDFILDNIKTINHIPIKIVQGAYDVVCTPTNAEKLKLKHANSSIHLTIAGHSAFETETKKALIKAVNDFKTYF